MKTLYFADDNKILITLPVGENLIFISRLIVYYVFELQRSLFLTIPIFLAFSIISGVGVLNYIWLPIVFIFVSAIPVLLGAILRLDRFGRSPCRRGASARCRWWISSISASLRCGVQARTRIWARFPR